MQEGWNESVLCARVCVSDLTIRRRYTIWNSGGGGGGGASRKNGKEMEKEMGIMVRVCVSHHAHGLSSSLLCVSIVDGCLYDRLTCLLLLLLG